MNILQMVEHFNQYFTPIGKNIQTSIPPSKRQISDYLKDPNQRSFFIQLTPAEEVKVIIITLIGSKSTEPNSIPKLKIMTILRLIHFFFLLRFPSSLQEHFQNYIFFFLFKAGL